MYKKSYKSASELADSIISGSYERPQISSGVEELKGLAQRPKREEVKSEVYDPSEDIMMQYFVSIRKQNQELKNELRPNQTGGQGPASISPSGSLGKAREALAMIESTDNYFAVGPVVESGAYKGDQAYGRYQVMGKNIGPWTEEILGRRYTIEEFLRDHEAQDAVAEYRLQENYDKYGTWEDAASVWFTGRPVAENNNDSDGYTTANEYVTKFQTALRRA